MSLAQTQQVAGFPIKTPTSLPRTLAYSSIRVASYPSGSLVYVLYSPEAIPANATADGLLSAGGFFVIENSEPTTDPGSVIDAYIKANGGSRVTIDGNPGMFTGSQVHWWSQGVHYAIVSPYSESDMMSTADSMGT